MRTCPLFWIAEAARRSRGGAREYPNHSGKATQAAEVEIDTHCASVE
jgi:hypothetical protein